MSKTTPTPTPDRTPMNPTDQARAYIEDIQKINARFGMSTVTSNKTVSSAVESAARTIIQLAAARRRAKT